MHNQTVERTNVLPKITESENEESKRDSDKLYSEEQKIEPDNTPRSGSSSEYCSESDSEEYYSESEEESSKPSEIDFFSDSAQLESVRSEPVVQNKPDFYWPETNSEIERYKAENYP
jgi:hypothetical protein